MRKFIILAALFLGACSNAQLAQINTALDQYDQAILNFNAAASRINASIALTSTSLAGYCDAAKAAGTNIAQIVKGNDTLLTYLDTITGGLNQYCAAPPMDVASAIVQMTAIVRAAQQAYRVQTNRPLL